MYANVAKVIVTILRKKNPTTLPISVFHAKETMPSIKHEKELIWNFMFFPFHLPFH